MHMWRSGQSRATVWLWGLVGAVGDKQGKEHSSLGSRGSDRSGKS